MLILLFGSFIFYTSSLFSTVSHLSITSWLRSSCLPSSLPYSLNSLFGVTVSFHFSEVCSVPKRLLCTSLIHIIHCSRQNMLGVLRINSNHTAWSYCKLLGKVSVSSTHSIVTPNVCSSDQSGPVINSLKYIHGSLLYRSFS